MKVLLLNPPCKFKASRQVTDETRKKIRKALMNKDPENLSRIFTEDHKQILFGSILGDASLTKCKVNYFFEEVHSIKQKDYLIWKNKYLKIFHGKLRDKLCENSKLNKIYRQIRLSTSAIPTITEYYRLFYKNNKKTISREILDQLNELGLTIWYLDDGSVRLVDNLITFSTDSYSYNEHFLISSWFRRKFGIFPRIYRRRGKYYLTFGRKDSNTLLLIFRRVFKSYNVPSCMWYKLGYLWKGNREKIKQAHEKKNNYKRKWRKKRSEIKRKKMLLRLKNIAKQIRNLYWKEGLSLSQTANKLGYSESYIFKMMKNFSIRRRTRSEACSGERNGFYGRHHSKESIEKMLKNKSLRGFGCESSFIKSTI